MLDFEKNTGGCVENLLLNNQTVTYFLNYVCDLENQGDDSI